MGEIMTKSFRSGPWRVLPPYAGTSRFPIGADRVDGATDILGEFNGQGGVGDEVTANARLAAAAPELLAALKWCKMTYGKDWPTNAAINDTIAKAEGFPA